MSEHDEHKWWVDLNGLPDAALELVRTARRREMARFAKAEAEGGTPNPIEVAVVEEAFAEIDQVMRSRRRHYTEPPEMSDGEVAQAMIAAHVAMEGAIAALTTERMDAARG